MNVVDVFPRPIGSNERADAIQAIAPLVPESVRDRVVLGLVVAEGDLHDTMMPKLALQAAERCTDLALLFGKGSWAIENLGRPDQRRYFTDYLSQTLTFTQFPVVLKMFVTGIEHQLKRKVGFVGRYHRDLQMWIPVPPDDHERWPRNVQPISPASR